MHKYDAQFFCDRVLLPCGYPAQAQEPQGGDQPRPYYGYEVYTTSQ